VEAFVLEAVLDTHTVLWALADDPRLGEGARRWIQPRGRSELGVASLTLLEVAMLIQKERIFIEGDPAAFLQQIEKQFSILEIESAVAWEAMSVSLPQGDPFDRIILATALHHRVPLLTRDQEITRSGLVEVIWS
jgi:PIN domain nuclease of toxin-antitoxin system